MTNISADSSSQNSENKHSAIIDGFKQDVIIRAATLTSKLLRKELVESDAEFHLEMVLAIYARKSGFSNETTEYFEQWISEKSTQREVVAQAYRRRKQIVEARKEERKEKIYDAAKNLKAIAKVIAKGILYVAGTYLVIIYLIWLVSKLGILLGIIAAIATAFCTNWIESLLRKLKR